MSDEPHSARHFTETRDLWWHRDYLDLIATRLGLRSCRSVLDLGAGVGHWTGLVLQLCAEDATVTAVDREPAWVSRLNARFGDRPGFIALEADANDLSGLEGPYDLVTCQTLLLHVPDVPKVLVQARRLLAPGGLLLLAEPNNFLNRIATSSVTVDLTPGEFGAVAELWWAFEKGRQALGLGQEWIADLLPKMVVDAGFQGLEVYQNDRTLPFFPPYDTPEQTVLLSEMAQSADREADLSEREEVRRCTVAGGLDTASFQRAWALIESMERQQRRAIAHGSFSSPGGGNLFLFAARNPRASSGLV